MNSIRALMRAFMSAVIWLPTCELLVHASPTNICEAGVDPLTGSFKVSFPSLLGATHRVDFSTDLSAGSWLASGTYGGTGATINTFHPISGKRGFFRVATNETGPATLFVDSVHGSDANDGLTEATALRSLSAAQMLTKPGEVIGLARGSYWREQYSFPASDVSFVVYGSGPIPVVDGADLAGTWVQADPESYSDVWSQNWARASAPTSSSEMLGYWENDVCPRYATSMADLQTNGGWYASSLTAQTAQIFIKAAANPNSDGIVREITKRQYGFNGHRATLLATRPGQQIIGPVEIKRCVGHYNALSLGEGTARNLLLRDGNIHHMVSEAPLVEDLLATGYSPNIAPSVYAAYRGAGAGFNPVMRRLLALMPGGDFRVTGSNSAFYSHSSIPQEVASFTLEGCISRGLNFASASAQRLTIRGSYCEDPYQSFVSSGAVLTEITHALIRDTTASANGIGNSVFSRAAVSTSFIASHVASYTLKGKAVRSVTGGTLPIIRHCAFVTGGSAIGMSGEEFDVKFSVFYNGGRPMDAITNLHKADYNVFYFVGQKNPILQWNGTVYSAVASAFQSYVNSSGQDQNSVYLNPVDQVSGNAYAFWLGLSTGTDAGPKDGDFRINPNARVYDRYNTERIGVYGDGVTPITQAGPQQHWDFNLRMVAAGPPAAYPVLPRDISEMRLYVDEPLVWNFYP